MSIRKPHHYRLYGCHLRASRELPWLAPLAVHPAEPDIELVVEEPSPLPAPDSGDWSLALQQRGPLNSELTAYLSSRSDGQWLQLQFRYHPSMISFIISPGGRRVRARRTEKVLLYNLTQLFLGSVMNCVLHWQGRLSLHAALVGVGSAAIAVVGGQGTGKSTTVAALADAGAAILSDDIAALTQDGPCWLAHAGLPTVRLRPDSHAILASSFPVSHPVWESCGVSEAERRMLFDKVIAETRPPGALPSPTRDYPLAAIYVLAERGARDEPVRVRPLAPAAGIVSLARQPATLPQILRPAAAARFQALGDLVRQTPVRLVERPDDMTTLPRLRDAILADAAALPSLEPAPP